MGAKVSLVGTHGTGKTTLLSKLIEHYPIFQHQVDNYSDAGVLFREKLLEVFDKNALQLYFYARHQYRVSINEYLLADRSVLDALCYAKYEYLQGNLKKEMFDYLERESLKLLNEKYTYLLWLRPEFELKGEGKRPEDTQYQITIDRIFEEYLTDQRKVWIPVKQLTGDLETRYREAVCIIDPLLNVHGLF